MSGTLRWCPTVIVNATCMAWLRNKLEVEGKTRERDNHSPRSSSGGNVARTRVSLFWGWPVKLFFVWWWEVAITCNWSLFETTHYLYIYIHIIIHAFHNHIYIYIFATSTGVFINSSLPKSISRVSCWAQCFRIWTYSLRSKKIATNSGVSIEFQTTSPQYHSHKKDLI